MSLVVNVVIMGIEEEVAAKTSKSGADVSELFLFRGLLCDSSLFALQFFTLCEWVLSML